jgi:uncharacterized protein (TIGR02145 family)
VSAGNSIQLPDGGGLSNGDLVFSGWNTEADGSGATRSAGSSYSPDGDITLYAKWNVGGDNDLSLVLADGEAWVSGDFGYIFTADNRVFSIFESDGGWWYRDTTGNYVTSGSIITINSVSGRYTISGNTLLLDGYTSTFEKTSGVNPQTPYYLRISVSGAGSVSRAPEKSVYSYGEQVTVTATENYFYIGLTGWSGASESTNATIIVTMDSDKNLTANFAVVTTFTDSRDGKTYKKVVIGTQTWMGENLNYDVPNVTSDVCYGGRVDSCAKYGRLYNWSTAMNGASSSSLSPSRVQGVCPAGWHVPSNAEWTAWVIAVGGLSTADRKLKSMSGWSSGNGTDQYGFSALPGGQGGPGGSFSNAGGYGSWWSATEIDASSAWRLDMNSSGDEYVGRHHISKTMLFSVRCVMDE